MKTIQLTIDGIPITVEAGATILEAARCAGIAIPTLCHDERVAAFGACGLCVVECEGMPKLLRACASKAADGMNVQTQSPRVRASRKFALSLLLSDHLGDCVAPCSLACPAGTDCQGYAGLIANGETAEAARLIREKIPLPAAIGRICPHPCETACRRKLVEEPIAIAALKSTAGDFALANKLPLPRPMADSGKRVAVLGGGPGGLTAAFFLRQKGHSVTVYEQMPHMGGMLRYGIPEYRLPKAILQQEIDLLAQTGIAMRCNTNIGQNITLDALRAENDAVVVAIGAWSSGKMRVAGETLSSVYGGIDFLRETVLGAPPAIGQRVAVCGGGNTAMDACRTARRLGAKDVYIIYRRTRDEMPAEAVEIEEAMEEGVQFLFLTNPAEITGENGRVTGMTLQKMQLGEPDASGRRSPVPMEGETEFLPLDSVIMAIGQSPNLAGFEALDASRRQTILADERRFTTNLDGVFAVGDATNKGADIAISAIGEAHKAAQVIDGYLAGQAVPYEKPLLSERSVTAADFAEKAKQARAQQEILPAQERCKSFAAIVKTLPPDAAQREASRCLECGCMDYHECRLIAYAREYKADPAPFGVSRAANGADLSHPYLSHEFDKCILCGLCVRVCSETMDVTALGMNGRGFTTVVSPEFGNGLDASACIACGQCAALCPTGALTEKVPFRKAVPLQEAVTETICPGCAVGCKMNLHTVGRSVTRCTPAENGLACAEGRFGFAAVNDPARTTLPLVNGKQRDWELALAETAALLAAHRGKTLVLLSQTLTDEAAEAALSLAKVCGAAYRFLPQRKLAEKQPPERVFGAAYRQGANAALDCLPLYDAKNPPEAALILVIGADAPPLPNGIASCVIGHTPANEAVFLPAPHYAETAGTLTAADGTKRAMQCALTPAGGLDLTEILEKIQLK